MSINSRWYKSDFVTDQFRDQSLDSLWGKPKEKYIEWIKTVPHMQVLDAPDLGQVCHNYALTKILGSDPLPLFEKYGTANSNRMLFVLEKLFTPISNPHNGDLIVYYNHKFDLTDQITHSGITRDNDLVESKWGNMPAVFIHPTFYTYYVLGEEVRYFTPKK